MPRPYTKVGRANDYAVRRAATVRPCGLYQQEN
jgi:hypothetical protein